MNLLPYPRTLQRHSGHFVLPESAMVYLEPSLPRDMVMLPIMRRLRHVNGITLEAFTGPLKHPRLAVQIVRGGNAPNKVDGYSLEINSRGVHIRYHDEGGLRASVATLRQLLREYGRHLPCLSISDYPDFAKRGLMLDISRGRVPNLETLMTLVSQLADLKVNEFQLYTEHTFAYRNYEPVWRDWGALTGEEILRLDKYCRELGIELVPNQNSFGHLRYWLAYPPLKKIAETPAPWPDQGGAFLRHPATLAPNHPGTLPFLRGLYDELLPHFTSKRFNVGCDETWDLGRGQSKALCEKLGKGRVYVDFLKKIHRECRARKKQMLFWGDIIIHYPELVKELPKDVVALNWGYEADHPFDAEGAIFSKSKMPYYVCPGTSAWMSIIGRHDVGFTNLKSAAVIGHKHGAIGYLNTDWGDGGHLQPLAVSFLPYLVGAMAGWCSKTYDEKLLQPVVNRDVFCDPTGNAGKAALALGFAHRKFKYTAQNITPFGAAIAAPPPKLRELFCRDGLKYYARIPAKNIRAALEEVEHQRAVLARADAGSRQRIEHRELDLAARMAAESCHLMLWQQALATGHTGEAGRQAKHAVKRLQQLDYDFNAYWPLRNKGTRKLYWPFLKWRIADYKRGVLHFPPEIAAIIKKSTSAD